MEIRIKNSLTPDEYNSLVSSVGWQTKNIELIARAINSSTIVKKAIVNNTTVGMGRAIGDGMSYLISDVVVDPKYQGKGIGKKIMMEILQEISNLTLSNESCSVNLISFSGKEGFYEQCGFSRTPYDYNGYGMKMKITNI